MQARTVVRAVLDFGPALVSFFLSFACKCEWHLYHADFHGSQVANPVWGIILFPPNGVPQNAETNLLYQMGSAPVPGK